MPVPTAIERERAESERRSLLRETAEPGWGGVAAEHFVAFDLETTGFSPLRNTPTEIGAVRFDGTGRVLGELMLRIDPGPRPMTATIVRLTGLHDADVRGAMDVHDAMRCLEAFVDGAYLVGHNVSFDVGFASFYLPKRFTRGRGFDTLGLARILMPNRPGYTLIELTSSLHLDHERPHTALGDARATRSVFLELIAATREVPAEALVLLSRKAAAHGFNRHARFLTLMAADRERAQTRPPAARPTTHPPSRRPPGSSPPPARSAATRAVTPLPPSTASAASAALTDLR